MRRKDLGRRPSFKDTRKRYLIVCEGSKTERLYLEGINRYWERPAVLEIRHKFSSLREIVQHAVDLKAESKRKSKTDPLWVFDTIWCFFDRDDHPNISGALIQARDNNIHVVFSDPNFELWLLLHFQDQAAFLSREDAARTCRAHMPLYGKEPDMTVLCPRFEDAVRRARVLRVRQELNGLTRQNPWTEADVFLEKLRPDQKSYEGSTRHRIPNRR